MQRRSFVAMLAAPFVLPLQKIFVQPYLPDVMRRAYERAMVDTYGEPPQAFYDLVNSNAVWTEWYRYNDALIEVADIICPDLPLYEAYPHMIRKGSWTAFYAVAGVATGASDEQRAIAKQMAERSLKDIARRLYLNLPTS